jgi:hypothetical protein
MSVKEINEPINAKTGGFASVAQVTDMTSSIQFSQANSSSAVAYTVTPLQRVQPAEEETTPSFLEVLRKSLRENRDILEELRQH